MPSLVRALSSRPILFTAGLLGAGLVFFGSLFFYGKAGVSEGREDPMTHLSAALFRFSLATVNGASIPYTDYLSEKKSLIHFYNTLGETEKKDDEIARQVVSRLLTQTVIEDLAKRNRIPLLADDVKAAKEELLSQFPDDREAKKAIQNYFGWGLNTYAQKVLKPLILEERLADFFRFSPNALSGFYKTTEVRVEHLLFAVGAETERNKVKQEASRALKRAQSNESLENIARNMPEEAVTEFGELGWMTRHTIPPGLESFGTALFDLEGGEVAGRLIESSFGFHIVKVLEERTVGDFGAFMDTALQNAVITMHAKVPHPFDKAED